MFVSSLPRCGSTTERLEPGLHDCDKPRQAVLELHCPLHRVLLG